MYRTTLYSVVLSICGYSVIGNDMAKERDRVFYICIYIYIFYEARNKSRATDERRCNERRMAERKIVGEKKEKIRGEKREEKARTRRDEA